MSVRPWFAVAALAVSAAAVALALGGEDRPFAPSLLATSTGEPVEPDWGYSSADCAECHPRQHAEWKGSIHSQAHHDSLYLLFAEMARKEDPALYRFCSGCHAPAAVASGEIPGGKGRETTFHTDEGVSCVVCHSIEGMKVVHAGGGANASVVLGSGDTMYGPISDPVKTPAHASAHSPLHSKAALCSNCHTLIHPTNGLVIENTYEEWRKSPYAEAGIHCQDCHMRTVEEAVRVAETMKPIQVPGPTTNSAETRPNVHSHTFVGASVNHLVNGTSEFHAAEAEKRLRSAATVALSLPDGAAPGTKVRVEVAVTNKGAGHAIPTSITELRQVWIDLAVKDATGREVWRSGAIDATGRVDPKAVMYHSVLADEKGEVTYLPWRAAKMLHEKLIPPKATVREPYDVEIPADAKPPFAVTATLRYRSAPQDKLDQLVGKGKMVIRAVDMASATGTIPAR